MNKNLSPEKEKSKSLDGSDQVAVRKDKLDRMREMGIDPFRSNWDQTHVSIEAVSLLQEDEELGPEVSVAGRIIAFRLMGKASFIKILDRAGKIQSYVRKDEIGEDEYALFKKLDLISLTLFSSISFVGSLSLLVIGATKSAKRPKK